MKITQTQLREAAEILYPDEWRDDRANAILKTLKFFDDPVFNSETRPSKAAKTNKETAVEVVDLQGHLKKKEIHISAAAKAIGVTGVTLYSWFNGHSRPNQENLTRIRSFLAKT